HLSPTIQLALGLLPASDYADPTTQPSVSVSGVTATAPVLRLTTNIGVSATLAATYDSSSGPSDSTQTSSCNPGNNNCGTGNGAVKSRKVVTTTTVTVTAGSPTVSASDFNDTGDLSPVSGTTYSGMLDTPLSGTDGWKNYG